MIRPARVAVLCLADDYKPGFRHIGRISCARPRTAHGAAPHAGGARRVRPMLV
ncbi:hypothetical protein C7S13_2109 [Burkholderia cepacia]|nr:hypothetical protein [Burkholderia cepacia]